MRQTTNKSGCFHCGFMWTKSMCLWKRVCACRATGGLPALWCAPGQAHAECFRPFESSGLGAHGWRKLCAEFSWTFQRFSRNVNEDVKEINRFCPFVSSFLFGHAVVRTWGPNSLLPFYFLEIFLFSLYARPSSYLSQFELVAGESIFCRRKKRNTVLEVHADSITREVQINTLKNKRKLNPRAVSSVKDERVTHP